MESKPAGNFVTSLDPIYTGAMAEKINTNIVERTNKRNIRGVSPDLARIERLRELNRMIGLKLHGKNYPFWIEDLFLEFQIYLPEDIRVEVIRH